MELQVREARLTDIDRLRGLIEQASQGSSVGDHSSAADLLRRLIYLPNAAILVALDGRQTLGMAVLALRPSVAEGGLVGTLDMLAVEPGHELAGVTETLIDEVIRGARNKGCVMIEVTPPDEPAELKRLHALGFADGGPRLSRSLVSQGQGPVEPARAAGTTEQQEN